MTVGSRLRFPHRAIFAVLFAFLSAALWAAYRTERRVEHDAAFCAASCHHSIEPSNSGMLVVGEHARKGHADIECQQCHATPLRSGLKLMWESLSKRDRVEPHGKIAAHTCEGCHEKRPSEWRTIENTFGHRAHRNVQGVDCLSCHSADAHTDEPPEKACIACHKAETLHKATTVGAETCLSCHVFAATPKNATLPTTVACIKCHADPHVVELSAGFSLSRTMKPVNSQAVHGGVACQLCHNAHEKELKAPAGQPVCANCHQVEQSQVSMEGQTGPDEHRKCVGCHQPHAARDAVLSTCIHCHESKAKGLTVIGPEPTTALKHESCTSCHLPHTWKATTAECVDCHKEEANLVRTASPAQHGACTSCHDVHGPPPTGAVCLNCHAGKSEHLRDAPERHRDCTSCHNPHAPRPEETRESCARCHMTEHSQTMDGPEAHSKATCVGCHKPHENPLPVANICSQCHEERAKTVAEAAPAQHRVCTSCHEPHSFRIGKIVTVCAKCHGPMFETDSGEEKDVVHRGDCKSCHSLHGSPGVTKASCFGCHEDVRSEFHPPNDKHAVCASCHTPHAPARSAIAACGSCHAAIESIAREWPSASAHAAACTGCHQPHDVRVKKACVNCHKEEATAAAGGKHQCTQCHAPHEEPPGTGKAWWSRCASCHADKAESVKARGPVHSDCQNCHQQHRFAVPTCTSCHKDMATKGLHAVQQHAVNCTQCHDPHVKNSPGPQQCLSCHADRRNHEPDAKRCQTCHLFEN